MSATAGYVVERVEATGLSAAQRSEWDGLHGRQNGVSNPFCSSDWVLEWYRSYVPDPAHRHLLQVRDADGALAGVAALYEQTVGPRRLPVGRRIVPVGYGTATALELPQVLTTAQHARGVHHAVVRWTRDAGADWSELPIAREQAWFEPGWVEDTTAEAPHYSHRASRACVVLPLSGTWEEMKGGLKRNLKESLRRSRNRLTKSGRDWHVRTLEGTEVDETAVQRFFTLHAARAGFDGTTSSHPDVYADTTRRDMLVRLVPKLAQAKEASLVELVVDGDVVAVQLALHSAGTSYVHSSGLNPDYWEFSAVTLLQAELVQSAIARGDRFVNFSPGPNVAKMRWSETMHVVDDFAYATGSRTSGLRFLAFSQLAAVNQYRHAVAVARANSPRPRPTGTSGT
ncbi:GNAT family N-acetyltransferase [Kineococcus aurantiacus]|uniref:CelD/BcsL family acetyltransferase involved in cellulose biosynthesis n=1 Tax=Kineococcus aurantiacus TaxID=37633 RepID=A0A7Y9J327_9ACTN|nr:GNAT family N-acetyltransferase [Kineococcus aurantiacus]NYD24755.1 CelD/BcsL family acetyltransferase involved in cellulose biosynthesis [Kineococcus aurantiacus]